jgi:hypothetical protein
MHQTVERVMQIIRPLSRPTMALLAAACQFRRLKWKWALLPKPQRPLRLNAA